MAYIFALFIFLFTCVLAAPISVPATHINARLPAVEKLSVLSGTYPHHYERDLLGKRSFVDDYEPHFLEKRTGSLRKRADVGDMPIVHRRSFFSKIKSTVNVSNSRAIVLDGSIYVCYAESD